MSSARSTDAVLIGAGSASFGPPLLYDLLTRVFPNGGTLSLVDLDAASLTLMERAAVLMRDRLGVQVEIRSATERNEVLAGAHFVLIAAERDRIGRWRLDWEIPRRFGIRHTLGENRGPAGLSHTLRTAPLVLEICRDAERLAPGALAVILTNPEDRLAYAVTRYTGLAAYGFCDGLWDFKDHLLGRLLGLPGSEIYLHGAGINHAVWITALRHKKTGDDLYPLMVRRAEESGWQPFGRHLYELYGLWPHENDEHYGEYFHYTEEFFPSTGYDFEAHLAQDRLWKERLGRLAAGDYGIDPFVAETRRFVEEVFGDAPPSDVLRGAHLGEPTFLQNANIPNQGKLPGLPDDMIVELPAVATPAGIFGLQFPRLPEPIMAFLQREAAIQKLSVEAAVEGSRRKALAALLLDPQVRGLKMAQGLLDAFLEAHRGYLPEAQWQGLRG